MSVMTPSCANLSSDEHSNSCRSFNVICEWRGDAVGPTRAFRPAPLVNDHFISTNEVIK